MHDLIGKTCPGHRLHQGIGAAAARGMGPARMRRRRGTGAAPANRPSGLRRYPRRRRRGRYCARRHRRGWHGGTAGSSKPLPRSAALDVLVNNAAEPDRAPGRSRRPRTNCSKRHNRAQRPAGVAACARPCASSAPRRHPNIRRGRDHQPQLHPPRAPAAAGVVAVRGQQGVRRHLLARAGREVAPEASG